MSNEHPYRPCPSCGGVEFDSVPDLSVELRAAKAMGRALMHSQISGAHHLIFTLVVCSGCGKTDFYTKNAAAIVAGREGSSHFRAAGR